jgi:ABC-type branched-subunit amino acid transport system substrate-binding protein
MKTKTFYGILTSIVLILILWACAPKPVVVTEPEAVAPGHELFSEAEMLYQANLLDQALEAYQQYIERYPQGPKAPAAILKVGMIHIAKSDYASARKSFMRVIADYPESALVGDAKIATLESYYLEGRYDDVVQLASVILEELTRADQIARTYAVLGDTYTAMDSVEDAIYFYSMAYKETAPDRRPEILDKLKAAIALLETDEIVALLEFIQEDPPRSDLMFQLGRNYAAEAEYDDALRVLSEFLATFPEHENADRAKLLIDEISEKTFYHPTTVGCLFPLSGRYKAYGERALKGVEFAMTQISQRYNDPPLELIIKDTASDPDQAVTAAEELVQERVAAIIGPLINAEHVAEIAQKNGIPIITITQKEKITEIGDYVFRNFLTPEMQVKRLVSYAADVLDVKNYAILYPEEKYGFTFMNLFWDEVVRHNGHVVGVEAYNPSHTDFAEPIKKLVGLFYDVPADLAEIVRPPKPEESPPQTDDSLADEKKRKEEEGPEAIVDFEAVFIPDAPNKTGLIIPQLAFYDIENVYLLGTNLWHSPKLIEMAKDYVQGAIMPDGFFPDGQSRYVQEFVRRFEFYYGHKPGVIEATTYDSASMLFQILYRPNIRSRNAIKNELLGVKDFAGMTGRTSFDETGDAQKELTLLRIYGSRFAELE